MEQQVSAHTVQIRQGAVLEVSEESMDCCQTLVSCADTDFADFFQIDKKAFNPFGIEFFVFQLFGRQPVFCLIEFHELYKCIQRRAICRWSVCKH